MTTNATQASSFYNGFAFCNVPAEIYVGGFMRRPGIGRNGTLTVTTPSALTDGAGDTIPISQISWTSDGNADLGTEPFPAGTFSGGTQTLANWTTNTWEESCHTFSYANASIVASGVYTAVAVYTMSMP